MMGRNCFKHSIASSVFLFSSLLVNGEITSLSPCPNKPNCVCSCEQDASHYIESFPLYIDDMTSLNLLKQVILSFPRTKILQEEEKYIHAEFTSLIFRFVDDVEFLFNQERNVIEVRSASRIGYSDLGVNRSRVERLRALYLEKIQKKQMSNTD